MKILVCGDLHCKPNLLRRALNCAKWDYFVFLGDACDNFGATQENNIEMIQLLVRVKKKYGDKFIWLIGNHDWGYYDTSVDMSGHIHPGEANVHYLLKEHRDLWEIFWQKGKYIFSHAGIGLDFVASIEHTNYDEIKNNPGLNNPLNQVGIACGGFSRSASPIWARPSEIEPLPPEEGLIQVVGHTPVETIHFSDNGLLLCDTMSQYPDKRFFGDQTLLAIEGNVDRGMAELKAINPKTGRKMYAVS